jgi:hypothetical protein
VDRDCWNQSADRQFSIEGPLNKDKTSIIAGFRTTYSDWLLRQIPSSSYTNSTASFYDASVHLSHIINAKNVLYLTGYMSSDHFKLNEDTSYDYANRNVNVKWKHNFSNTHYAVFTSVLITTNIRYPAQSSNQCL